MLGCHPTPPTDPRVSLSATLTRTDQSRGVVSGQQVLVQGKGSLPQSHADGAARLRDADISGAEHAGLRVSAGVGLTASSVSS
jgi:hypothetical protein